MEACLHHVPDDMLDEAEEITGLRRCRHRFGEDDACRQIAATGTQPPQCKNHGGNNGSYQRKIGAERVVEGKTDTRLGEILNSGAMRHRLDDPPPIGNPLAELLDLAAEIKAFRGMLRDMIVKMDMSTWRYTRSQAGEQVRAEITLYERSTERLAGILISVAKLGIETRLAALQEAQVQMVERAVSLALAASGADLEGQDRARTVLYRELTRAEQ